MSYVIYENHFDEFKNANEEKLARALNIVAKKAEGISLGLAQAQDIHDTGNLWNHINGSVQEHTVFLRDGVEYGIYNEMGTGIENVAGGTPKKYWYYMDELGRWHCAHPMKARPFIKPAIADHVEEYRSIIQKELSK